MSTCNFFFNKKKASDISLEFKDYALDLEFKP